MEWFSDKEQMATTAELYQTIIKILPNARIDGTESEEFLNAYLVQLRKTPATSTARSDATPAGSETVFRTDVAAPTVDTDAKEIAEHLARLDNCFEPPDARRMIPRTRADGTTMTNEEYSKRLESFFESTDPENRLPSPRTCATL